MRDLIDRQAAIDAINKAFERVFAWDGTSPLGDKVLENVPSAQPPQHPYIASYYISKGREKGYYRFHPLCRACAYAYERGVIEMNGNTYQEPDEFNEEKYKKEIGYKAEDEEDDKG